MTWSPTISAERIALLSEWFSKVEKIDTALTQTRDAVQQMSLWSNSLAKRGAHVQKLSEMSFKKGIQGMTQQLVQILEESQRLYRKDDLVEWRGTFTHGQFFYNTDFDAKTIIHLCVYMYVCMYKYICNIIHSCQSIHMYTYIYILLNKCTFVTIIYNCIHVCIHLVVFTHTHKHTHIHIHTRSSLSRVVAWGSQTIVYLHVIYLHEHSDNWFPQYLRWRSPVAPILTHDCEGL
jgi:hypothetical protein